MVRTGTWKGLEAVKAYYRLWFEYLREAPAYRHYAALAKTGWTYTPPPRSPFRATDLEQVPRLMEIFTLFGDPEGEFEQAWPRIRDWLSIASPVEPATNEICESLLESARLHEVFFKHSLTLDEFFRGVTHRQRLNDGGEAVVHSPSLLEALKESQRDGGFFYLKVTPGIHSLDTLKESFGKTLETVLKDWEKHPPFWHAPGVLFHPPRTLSRKRIEEWEKYLRVYRARKRDSLSFKKIALLEAQNGTLPRIASGEAPDHREVKTLSGWHRKACRIIANIDLGLPLASQDIHVRK
jgi:hypothetical protein